MGGDDLHEGSWAAWCWQRDGHGCSAAASHLLVATHGGLLFALPVLPSGKGGGQLELAAGEAQPLWASPLPVAALAPLPGGQLLAAQEWGDLLLLATAAADSASSSSAATHHPVARLVQPPPLAGALAADLRGEGSAQLYTASAAPGGGVFVASAVAPVKALGASEPTFPGVTGLWALPLRCAGGLLVLGFVDASRALAVGGAHAGARGFVDATDEVGLHSDEATLAAGLVGEALAVQVCPRGAYLCSLEPLLLGAGGERGGRRNVRHSPQDRRLEARNGAAAMPLARQALFGAAARAASLNPPEGSHTAPIAGSSATPGSSLAAAGYAAVAAAARRSPAPDTSSTSTGSGDSGGGRTCADAHTSSDCSWRPMALKEGRTTAITLAAVDGSGLVAVVLSGGAAHTVVVLQAVSSSDSGSAAASAGSVAATADTASSPGRPASRQRKRGRSHWVLVEAGRLALGEQLSCLALAPWAGVPRWPPPSTDTGNCGGCWLLAGCYDGSLELLAAVPRPSTGGGGLELQRMRTLPAEQLHPLSGLQPARANGSVAAPVPHTIAVLPPPSACSGGGACSRAGGASATASAPRSSAMSCRAEAESEAGTLRLVVSFRDGSVALIEAGQRQEQALQLLSHVQTGCTPLQLQLLPAARPQPPCSRQQPQPQQLGPQLLATGDRAWLLERCAVSQRLECTPLGVGRGLAHAAALSLPAALLGGGASGGDACTDVASAGSVTVLAGVDGAGRLQLSALPRASSVAGLGCGPYLPTAQRLLAGHQVLHLALHPTSQLLLALVSEAEPPLPVLQATQPPQQGAAQRWPPPWHGLVCVRPGDGSQACTCAFNPEEAFTCMTLWDTAPPLPPEPPCAAPGGGSAGASTSTSSSPAAGGEARVTGSGGPPSASRRCLELRQVFTQFVRLNMLPGGGHPAASAQQAPQSHPCTTAASSGGGSSRRRSSDTGGGPATPLGPLIALATKWDGADAAAAAPGGSPPTGAPAARGCVYVLQLAAAPSASSGGTPTNHAHHSLSLVAHLRMPEPVAALADAGNGELAVGVGCRVVLYRLATARGRPGGGVGGSTQLVASCLVPTCARVVALEARPAAGLLGVVEVGVGLVLRSLQRGSGGSGGGNGMRLAVVAADGRCRQLAAVALAHDGDTTRTLALDESGRLLALAPAAAACGPVPNLAAAAVHELRCLAPGWSQVWEQQSRQGAGGGGASDTALVVPTLAGGALRMAWLPQAQGRVLAALQRALLRTPGAAPLGGGGVVAAHSGGQAEAKTAAAVTVVDGALLRSLLALPRALQEAVAADAAAQLAGGGATQMDVEAVAAHVVLLATEAVLWRALGGGWAGSTL